MSWHHGDYIDLISAVGTAIAAGAAAYAAVQSRKSANDSFIQQQRSFKFERERHFHDLLRAQAMKANESVKNTKGQDWTFTQAANATYAIDAAKQIINSFDPQASPDDVERYKLLFLDQLNYEITSEMNQGHNMPDGFLNSHKGFIESREIFRLWLDNLRFFNFLKDEVE